MTPAEHPGGNAALTVTALKDRPGLRLCGGADFLSTGVLRAAIGALPAAARHLHFELAKLTFADVAATRELVTLARCPARPYLFLHQPPAVMTRIIGLLWPGCQFLAPYDP